MMTASSNRLGWRMALVAVLFGVNGMVAFAEDAAAKPSVRPYGLRIVPEPFGGDDMLRAFNAFEGTTVALLVEQAGGGLIAFDTDASKIDSFVDDKGKDLLKSSSEYGTSALPMSPNFSEEGKASVIDVTGGQTPSKGAKALHIKGKLVFQAASQQKTYTHKDLELKEGAKVEAGPIPLTIGKAGKPEWGEEPLEITFNAKKRLDEVASIRFLDADGKEIESHVSGSMMMTMMDEVSVERSYSVGKKVDKLSVEITYWTDMKALEIPLDVEVSLGL